MLHEIESLTVRLSIAMIINNSLMWPNESEKCLWTMSMAHAVHLQNHTPHISSGMSPEGA